MYKIYNSKKGVSPKNKKKRLSKKFRRFQELEFDNFILSGCHRVVRDQKRKNGGRRKIWDERVYSASGMSQVVNVIADELKCR